MTQPAIAAMLSVIPGFTTQLPGSPPPDVVKPGTAMDDHPRSDVVKPGTVMDDHPRPDVVKPGTAMDDHPCRQGYPRQVMPQIIGHHTD